MLVEHVKDNYYARFHNPSYHRYEKLIMTEVDRRNDGLTDRNSNASCYKQAH